MRSTPLGIMNNTQKIFLVTNFSLVLLLGWMIVKTITTQTPGPVQANPVSSDNSGQSSGQQEPVSSQDYQLILQRNLFGTSDGSDKPETIHSQVLINDEITKDLTLTGTIVGSPAIARAVIHSTQTDTTTVYKINDTIGTLHLIEIHPDKVYFRHDTRTVVLTKKTLLPNGKSANTPPSQKIPLDEPRNKTQRTLAVMEDFLMNARISPYQEYGRTTGLQINNLDNMKYRSFFGLKSGDIITHINGQQLTSTQKAYQVLQKALNQSQIQMNIVRDNHEKRITFPMR